MKFPTSSSSSSNASDTLSRKSTLCIYTDADMPPIHYEKMDTGSEAMELRRELDAVKSALQIQSESNLKQRHKLIEATNALQSKSSRAHKERKLRQDQLALVVRSLLLLESRLTKEQKQLDTALRQKDNLIRSQQEELAKLRSKKLYCNNCLQLLGFTSEQTNIETDPEFQSLESTDSRFKTTFLRSCSYHERQPAFQKNSRLSKSFQISKNDVVYGNSSSSEECNISVVKDNISVGKESFIRKDSTRRSRRSSGRKHNSTYLENVQKRYSSQANSSSAEECSGMKYNVNETIPESKHLPDNVQAKYHKKEDGNEKSFIRREPTFGSKIESLHGIRRPTSEIINSTRAEFLSNVLKTEVNEQPWYANNSDQEQEMTCGINKKIQKISFTKSQSAENLLGLDFANGTLVSEVISAKNEILCQQVKTDNKEKRNRERLCEEEESNENWYASAGSDPEEVPSCEIYKHNPVLECVNQILLQNSLDESCNEHSKSSNSPSPKSTKRVHFSTLNSISLEKNNALNNTLPRQNHDRRANKIVKFSLETASEHSYEVPNTAQGYNYEVQSIYSNDYEPIITRKIDANRPVPLPRTITPSVNTLELSSVVSKPGTIVFNTNHYTDLNSSFTDSYNKKKMLRVPPALPPKPKNLLSKFKLEKEKLLIDNKTDSEPVAANQRIPEVTTLREKIQTPSETPSTEPDYCSISEINVPVVVNGKREILLSQPTVEIHTEQYQEKEVLKNVAKVIPLPRILAKINDSDIPKLPQVKEIIIPCEDDPKIINDEMNQSVNTIPSLVKTQSNVLLHSPIKLEYKKSIQMGNSISSILSEIKRGVKSKDEATLISDLDKSENPNINMSEIFEEIDKFDLSQNFEEFKIDGCDLGNMDAEEYKISSSSSDGGGSDIVNEETHLPSLNKDTKNDVVIVENMVNNNFHIEIKVDRDFNLRNEQKQDAANHKLSNKPDLLSNIENLEGDCMRNSDIDSSNSSCSNSGSYNTVKCEPALTVNKESIHNRKMSFDLFLESSGLSSKSLLQTNSAQAQRSQFVHHKNVMKPKDVKARVKNALTMNKNIEKKTAIKYFEPYL